MRGLSSPPKIQSIRHKPDKPTGPKIIPKERLVPGPGDPPPGFLTGQNSLTEWICYWALARIFNNPPGDRVREQPFYGGWPEWGYQVAELGGHMRALGSAVVDFVIYQGGTIIGIRIQTERFHLFAGSRRIEYDAMQRMGLEANGMTMVDVYDDEILGDPSGQKAILAMKRAIGRLERVNPTVARTAIRASRLRQV